MLLRLIFLITLSLLLASCNDVDRPDAPACLVNSRGLRTICYNLKTDYDNQGNLKPSAKALVTQYADAATMLTALDKGFYTPSVGWTNIKIYIRKLRSRNDQSLVDDGSADDAELDNVNTGGSNETIK